MRKAERDQIDLRGKIGRRFVVFRLGETGQLSTSGLFRDGRPDRAGRFGLVQEDLAIRGHPFHRDILQVIWN